MTYVEQFSISDRTYAICNTGRAWVGGSCIGGVDHIANNRQRLHAYAVKEAQRTIARATAELAIAQNVLADLGDDPFNLGRYRVT